MYGGEDEPTVDKNTDFSRDAARLGWEYFAKGDDATAIRRFNQAWMFDRDNPEAYWGFGVIMGRRARTEEPEKNLLDSIRLLDMALARAPGNGRIMGDLAFSHAILGHYYQTDGHAPEKAAEPFRTAGDLFPKAAQIEAYPPTLANWSVYEFYTGHYPEAKEKADAAVKAGYTFDDGYLRDLQSHL